MYLNPSLDCWSPSWERDGEVHWLAEWRKQLARCFVCTGAPTSSCLSSSARLGIAQTRLSSLSSASSLSCTFPHSFLALCPVCPLVFGTAPGSFLFFFVFVMSSSDKSHTIFRSYLYPFTACWPPLVTSPPRSVPFSLSSFIHRVCYRHFFF